MCCESILKAILFYSAVVNNKVYKSTDNSTVGIHQADGDAPIAQFPHMALINLNGSLECGGAILAPLYIGTAAHCRDKTIPLDQYTVQIAAYNVDDDKETYFVKDFYIHDKYEGYANGHDIAIIELSTAIDFSTTTARAIPLASYRANNIECVLSGYGATQEDPEVVFPGHLLQARFPILTNSYCQNFFKQIGRFFGNGMMCGGYKRNVSQPHEKNFCVKDSGSPLICPKKTKPDEFEVHGFVSWDSSCEANNYPNVYSSVWDEDNLQWIKKITGLRRKTAQKSLTL